MWPADASDCLGALQGHSSAPIVDCFFTCRRTASGGQFMVLKRWFRTAWGVLQSAWSGGEKGLRTHCKRGSRRHCFSECCRCSTDNHLTKLITSRNSHDVIIQCINLQYYTLNCASCRVLRMSPYIGTPFRWLHCQLSLPFERVLSAKRASLMLSEIHPSLAHLLMEALGMFLIIPARSYVPWKMLPCFAKNCLTFISKSSLALNHSP